MKSSIFLLAICSLLFVFQSSAALTCGPGYKVWNPQSDVNPFTSETDCYPVPVCYPASPATCEKQNMSYSQNPFENNCAPASCVKKSTSTDIPGYPGGISFGG